VRGFSASFVNGTRPSKRERPPDRQKFSASPLATSYLAPSFELDTSNTSPAAAIVMTRAEHYAAADSSMPGPNERPCLPTL